MKKSLIISSILLLGVAMSAAPSSPLDLKGKLELLKKNKGTSLPAIKHAKREGTCTAISCTEPESQCTDSSYCQAGTSCFDGECRMNTIGDACNADDECTGLVTCDRATKKCVRKVGLGGDCSSLDCEEGLDCTNFVCTQPPKLGDPCESSFFGDNCPSGLTCSGGVCVTLPGLGEACTESGACGAGLMCDSTEGTCKKTPKAGDPCIGGKCSANFFSQDLYCDNSNVCRKAKVLGESCSSSEPCDINLYECGTDGKCKKYDAGGSCTSDNDCDGSQTCFNSVCTNVFSLDEGAECPYSEQGTSMGGTEMFLCKEGLGCVPNRDTGSGYVCKKIETKFSDNLPCESDSDCPADSACTCNSATGAMQCYPYMVSSQKTYDLVYDYAMTLVSCFTGECDEKEMERLTLEIAELSDPNSPELRCYVNYTYVPPPLPPEPAVSSSVVPPIEPSASSSEVPPEPAVSSSVVPPYEPSSSSGKHTSETSTSSGKHASETSSSFEVPVESSTPASDHPAKASSSIDGSPSFAGQAFVMPLIYLVAVAVMFL